MKLEIIKPYLGCSVGTVIDTSMQSLHLDPEDLIRSGYARQATEGEMPTLLPEEVGKEMGRPREYFVVTAVRGKVSISNKREPDKQYKGANVYDLTARKDIDFLIRELQKARDYAFSRGTPGD